MASPLQTLAAINARENAAHQALAKLKPGQPDFGGDGIEDCEDYAAAKKFAPDWPAEITPQDYNVTLPDGQLHRVVVAPYQGKNWVMDNYSGNALLTKEDWERGGWKFEPFTAPKLQTSRDSARGMLALGATGASAPQPPPENLLAKAMTAPR